MCKQFFPLFLLLFPLALNAQQPQSDPELTSATLFVAADAILVPAPGPNHVSQGSTLPNAPEPLSAELRTGNDEKDALLTGVYEQKQAPKPELPIVPGGVWSNKKLIAIHAAFLGSIVYDTELTHQGLAHHNCAEANSNFGSHPSRGKIYRQNMLAFGAVSGFDWFTAKARIRYIPYIGPAVGTIVHVTAGSKWLAQCW